MDEPQENESNSGVISNDQAYLYFKKDKESIDKDYVKPQWRKIYEVIDYIFSNNDYFTTEFF